MPAWDDLNAARITPLIAYTEADGVTLWHWCVAADPGDWLPTPITADDVTGHDPLGLSDLVNWPCCGLRGHIRTGHWSPA